MAHLAESGLHVVAVVVLVDKLSAVVPHDLPYLGGDVHLVAVVDEIVHLGVVLILFLLY